MDHEKICSDESSESDSHQDDDRADASECDRSGSTPEQGYACNIEETSLRDVEGMEYLYICRQGSYEHQTAEKCGDGSTEIACSIRNVWCLDQAHSGYRAHTMSHAFFLVGIMGSTSGPSDVWVFL